MTTNQYIRGVKKHVYLPFNKRLWQRNYFERIVRDESEFFEIKEYIRLNPVNWINDKYIFDGHPNGLG